MQPFTVQCCFFPSPQKSSRVILTPRTALRKHEDHDFITQSIPFLKLTVCTAKKKTTGVGFLISFLLGAKKNRRFCKGFFLPSPGASSSSLPPHSAKSLRLGLRRPAPVVGEGWGNETRSGLDVSLKKNIQGEGMQSFLKTFLYIENHGSRTSTTKSHKLLIYK